MSLSAKVPTCCVGNILHPAKSELLLKNCFLLKILPFSLAVICKVSSVMIPSVNGSSSSLTVVLERAGTHLLDKLKHNQMSFCNVLEYSSVAS